MEFIDGTLSGAVKVGKASGVGFGIVKVTDDGLHGEVKCFAEDHVIEVTTVRPAVYGEPEFDMDIAKEDPPGVQPDVTRVCRAVLTADAARTTGVYLETSPDAPPPEGPIVATGATAGNPGSFTPTGAVAPADLAALASVTASPATAWLTGEHVILGDASHASWDSTAWVVGDGVALGTLSSRGGSAHIGHSAGHHPTQMPAPPTSPRKSGLKTE